MVRVVQVVRYDRRDRRAARVPTGPSGRVGDRLRWDAAVVPEGGTGPGDAIREQVVATTVAAGSVSPDRHHDRRKRAVTCAVRRRAGAVGGAGGQRCQIRQIRQISRTIASSDR